jgi:hypothetical protein
MDSSDLAFYTTQELIDELLSRRTFLGVVVQADELRTAAWKHGKHSFRVRFNKNLKANEAGRLLGVIADRMEERV